MSDRFPAEITIGGNIPRRLLEELAGMVASEGVSLDWQYALDQAGVRAAIETAAAKGETVRFTDDEACYAEWWIMRSDLLWAAWTGGDRAALLSIITDPPGTEGACRLACTGVACGLAPGVC